MSSDITANHEDHRSLSRSHSTSSSRFGTKSLNMFFSRNVAHPRNLRFITGVAGSQICAVKEDQFSLPREQYNQIKEQYNVAPAPNRLLSASTSVLVDPYFSLTHQPNYDQATLQAYSSKLMPRKKKERLLPPISFWSTYGVVSDDTHRWKEELRNLASSVGLMTSEELKTATERLQKEKNIIPATPKRRLSYLAEANKPSTSEYSRETGRLNEPPKPRTSRSRSGGLKTFPHVYCVDNGEREMWMIQVLCQILQTESMQDVQSWLVSAGPSEKDAARELIERALQGLQESGRIEYDHPPSNNNKEIQVDLNQIQETLQRITETQQQNRALLTDPSLNPIYENEEAVSKSINYSNEVTKASSERAKTALSNQQQTPLERLLSQSQNFNKPPLKTPSVHTESKYALNPVKNENETRPYTADLFKSKSDSKSDKKLSAKIIKELVNFVEVDRQSKTTKTPGPGDKASQKMQLFPPPPLSPSKSSKVRVTKNSEKDSQVLTIED